MANDWLSETIEASLGRLGTLRAEIAAVVSRLEVRRVSSDLRSNVHRIREVLGRSSDLVVREFDLGGDPQVPGAVVYIDGLADAERAGEQILETLVRCSPVPAAASLAGGAGLMDALRSHVITVANARLEGDLESAIGAVLRGSSLVLVSGDHHALVCDMPGFETRPVEEPMSESGVRVPREGFTESLRVNTSLLRRRIQSPRLWIEELRIGRVTRTRVAIAYITGIVNEDLVGEVRRRLQRADIDGVLESGYLEEFIEDDPYSPFPQTLRTERPDVVAANLLEGRVAVLTDNTPFALVLPVVLSQLLTVSEDYYERFLIGSALRALRYLAFLVSMTLPSLYIAVITYHQEMLPTSLLLSIAAAREGVPFPALVEAGIMEAMFEVLREAGVRLPRVVGPAISIVGALILGQASIQASLVSPAMVIVVAATGIASFSTPVFSLAIAARMLRFLFMLAAAVMGLFGVMALGIGVLMHLCALRSFGIPYLSPMAPLVVSDWKDVLIRAPWWAMVRRPRLVARKKALWRTLDGAPEAPRVRRRAGREEEGRAG